jgi:hypothetical protein
MCEARSDEVSLPTLVIAGLVPATPITKHRRASTIGVAGTSPAMTLIFSYRTIYLTIHEPSSVHRSKGTVFSTPQLCARRGAAATYFTASMTPATLPKISAMSLSVAISGGVSARVSPVTRITRPSSWKAFSIAL